MSERGCRIVVAGPDRLPAVQALEHRIYARPWSGATFLLELGHPQPLSFVALDGEGGVVGYLFGWRGGDEAHLHNLTVAPEERRKGVATSLLHHFLRTAARQGARSSNLEVRTANLPAIRFYRRHGYRVAGWRPNYYDQPREDAFLMDRDLPQTPRTDDLS